MCELRKENGAIVGRECVQHCVLRCAALRCGGRGDIHGMDSVINVVVFKHISHTVVASVEEKSQGSTYDNRATLPQTQEKAPRIPQAFDLSHIKPGKHVPQSGTSLTSPLVCVASARKTIGRVVLYGDLTRKLGMYFTTGSSSDRLPWSLRRYAASVVKSFVLLAIRTIVSWVNGTCSVAFRATIHRE